MNKKDRQTIESLKDKIDGLVEEVRMYAELEQDKYDNAPENLQQSEKFQSIERIASNLEQAADNLEQASSDIDEALSD